MRRLCLSLISVAVGSGDMCQDLCLRELGVSGCSKGSWCKKEYDCHALFWTDSSRTNICVFDGTGNCRNIFPVLCREATARLTGEQGSTTSTTRTPGVPPSTTNRAQAPVTIPMRPIPSQMIELELHYSPLVISDCRPRVTVTFPSNRGQRIGFLLLLDSASTDFLIRGSEGDFNHDAPAVYQNVNYPYPRRDPVDRPARLNEGYTLDTSRVEFLDRPARLSYGSDDYIHSYAYSGRFFDDVLLFTGANSFTFGAEVYLGANDMSLALADGIMGGSPGSYFGRAAGRYAIMGPQVSFWRIPLLMLGRVSAGKLLIAPSDQDIQARCPGEIRYFPLIERLSHAWFIEGSIGFERDATTQYLENFNIDSGAGGMYAPLEMIETIKREFSAVAQMSSSGSGHERLDQYDCRAFIGRPLPLPDIRVTFGRGSETFTVTITPDDYVSRHTLGDGVVTCVVRIREGHNGGLRNRVMGTAVLWKLFTVFDSINHRVGFCNKE
jgi:hypothetical protein